MRLRGKIEHIACYAPERVVTSRDVESIVNRSGPYLPPDIIHQKFGVASRRYADQEIQASDLAVAAAQKILAKTGTKLIDCLIFAAGSSDLIEPATANIIQSKLRLSCPAFDIKNACNSFVN